MTPIISLWHHFLHDDLSSFTRLLSSAVFVAAFSSQSARDRDRDRDRDRERDKDKDKDKDKSSTITPLDLNAADSSGRTLLHLISSSARPTASAFAGALLNTVPLCYLDIYIQDKENGWTPLHRALYAGNVGIAKMLLARDEKEAVQYRKKGKTKTGDAARGGLLTIKDKEGITPLDLFGQTITLRNINPPPTALPLVRLGEYGDEDDDVNAADGDDFNDMDSSQSALNHALVKPALDLSADEIFTFGSNKNFSLGLGDYDDRTFPERISLPRPDHLLHRFYKEHISTRETASTKSSVEPEGVSDIPMTIRSQPIIIQDVAMSKLSTAILTSDPESNLFMAGFGPGGRLGTGDEGTRFNFVCVNTGGLTSKKVVHVATGQDHTIAITDRGEVFTWGVNKYGQLGYSLPRSITKGPSNSKTNQDVPMQLTPRQIYNPLKREVVIGAAASAIHSAVFTSSGLYTFGKNEGQLGFMDADARSLESQIVPRKVGAALFASPIKMVSAIDRATTVLLESNDVWVFAHYGYSRLIFPLDNPSTFIRNSFLTTRYGSEVNRIIKIVAAGNTIAGLSSFGEIYTVNLAPPSAASHPHTQLQTLSSPASGASSPSTTNPSKIRNAIPAPTRIWSPKKSYMAARDIGVGQAGALILCTESGSAWRRERRVPGASDGRDLRGERRDYKFVRVPGLSRVVAVRSNAFGAYAAIQKGSDIAKEGIEMPRKLLWEEIGGLLPSGIMNILTNSENGMTVRLKTGRQGDLEGGERLLRETCIECLGTMIEERGLVWVTSTECNIRFPVHRFMLMARSPVLSALLAKVTETERDDLPDLLSIEPSKTDHASSTNIALQGVDFLALFNLWLYIYTDKLYDIWFFARSDKKNGARHRQIRLDVLKVASALDMPGLERAARIQIPPVAKLHIDMETALSDTRFFDDADVVIELAGDEEVKAHSPILVQRSLFFKGMFGGLSHGQWLATRKASATTNDDVIRIDLRHIDAATFQFVLRYIYIDIDEELFDDVTCDTLDDLIDVIINVMAVANELMIDRLAQVCQKILGRYVNTRNVCHLLNAIDPCYVRAFRSAALEYMCINLETMLEGRFLDDLDAHLIHELDNVCHENQLACQPVARGRNSEEFLFERYPELVPLVEEDLQRRIDAMRLKSRLHDDEILEEKIRRGRAEKSDVSSPPKDIGTPHTPSLKSKASVRDLGTTMEEEATTPIGVTDPALPLPSPNISPATRQPWKFETPSRPPIDLSAIMAEASGSNATPQSTSSAQQLPATPSSSAKLSQKERKKLKQQQMREIMMEEEEKAQFRASPWSVKKETPSKANPAVASSPLDTRTERPGSVRASSSRAGMTLRQTVAGGSSSQARSPLASSTSKGKAPVRNQAAPPSPSISTTVQHEQQQGQQQRPVVNPNSPFAKMPLHRPSTSQQPGPSALSNGLKAAKAAPPPPAPDATTQAPPPIRSTRYNTNSPDPTPAELALRQNSLTSSTPTKSSLAAILLEQQTEKDVIREAATARHNLEEIQLEQEFQEWWDQESKRVQQQAESEAARSNRKGGRGRSGKGKAKAERADEGSRHARASGHDSKRKPKGEGASAKGGMDGPSQTQSDRRPAERGRGHQRRGRGGGRGPRGYDRARTD